VNLQEVEEAEAVGVGWVPATGALPAELAWVGEAPGWREVVRKQPFVGESGSVLWQLASRHAGVGRAGSYVTNWHKTVLEALLKKQYEKHPEQMDGWTDYLERELALVKPKTVVALGGYAVRALLGSEYSLFWTNGVPIDRGDLVVVPVVHPAAGLHESTLLEKTTQGLQGLRRWLRGEIVARPWTKWQPVGSTTRELAPPSQRGLRVAIDTEGTPDEPLCLTFSIDGSNATIIYTAEQEKLAAFQAWLRDAQPVLIFHNAAYDAAVLEAMGIWVWGNEIVDTMILAYNLQDIPRDLKNLTRRELGVHMDEYESVVQPYLDAEMAEWRQRLMEAVADSLNYEPVLTPKGKQRMKGGQPVYKLVGSERSLSIHKHLTRGQQLSLDETRWGENEVGKLHHLGNALSLVPAEVAVPYAGKDAIVTSALEPLLQKRIDAEGLRGVAQLDHQILPLMRSMQDTGLHLDIERYWQVLGKVSTRKTEVVEEIRQLVGLDDFNPGSSKQLSEYIDRETNMTLVKLTKGGAVSTNSDVLAQLKHEHPLIPLILEYRELDKYEGTYLLPSGQLIRETPNRGWRLFPQLSQTSVVSGRLAAYRPNVLAWPARTKLGLEIRSIFTAPPGCVLGSWDFSQIELRIVAALAQDSVMLDAFLSGKDLHTNLASKLFGVSYETVDKLTQRTPCKTVHYCLLYGGGGGKVYEELRSMGITAFTRDDCMKLVDDTWKLYSRTGSFLASAAQEARQRGFVTTILGRRRFLSGVQLVAGRDEWDIRNVSLEAGRQAGNFKVQGAASEIIKRAMVGVWEEVLPAVPGFRLWLQIHDELMGELPAAAWDDANRRMVEVMTRDSWITSPIQIETEGKFGACWADLK